jgi:glycosyltransferase involved in cell wall biosynthesis
VSREIGLTPASPPQAYLSLVTPVHNGEKFIQNSLAKILRALDPLGRPFEVIVVCDGCSDATARCARALGDDRVVVLDYPHNHGKGHAIAHGLGQAQGRLVGWLDSDLDIHPGVIVDAARRFDDQPIDAAVGSKRHPKSRVHYPLLRRVYSWGYQVLIRLLFRVSVRDTQVGAKLFRRELIETVEPLLLIKRYAFDLEVLAVGAEFGFDRIDEVPIELHYRFSGTGINWKAVRRMFIDTLAIAYRIHIRHWYVRRFASLQRERMDTVARADTRVRAQEPASASEPLVPANRRDG